MLPPPPPCFIYIYILFFQGISFVSYPRHHRESFDFTNIEKCRMFIIYLSLCFCLVFHAFCCSTLSKAKSAILVGWERMPHKQKQSKKIQNHMLYTLDWWRQDTGRWMDVGPFFWNKTSHRHDMLAIGKGDTSSYAIDINVSTKCQIALWSRPTPQYATW